MVAGMTRNLLYVRIGDLFRDKDAVLLAVLVLLFPVAKGASAAIALWQYLRARRQGAVAALPLAFVPGIVLLLGAVLLGLGVSESPRHTLRTAFAVLMALFFVWAVSRYAAFGDHRLQPAFLGAALVVSFVACLSWAFWQVADGPFLYRLQGIAPFTSRNLWSCSLALGWVAVLAVVFRRDMNARHAYLAQGLLVVLALLLIANSTPEAMVAACAAAGVMLALARPRVWAWATGLCVLAVCVLFWMVVSALPHDSLLGHAVERSNRVVLWEVSGAVIAKAPWFGHGAGTFKESAEVNALLPAGQKFAASPHNWALELVYSLGVVGSAVFLVGVAFLGLVARHHLPHGSEYLRLVGGGCLAVVLVNGLVDFRAFGLFFQCVVLGSGYLLVAWRPPSDGRPAV